MFGDSVLKQAGSLRHRRFGLGILKICSGVGFTRSAIHLLASTPPIPHLCLGNANLLGFGSGAAYVACAPGRQKGRSHDFCLALSNCGEAALEI